MLLRAAVLVLLPGIVMGTMPQDAHPFSPGSTWGTNTIYYIYTQVVPQDWRPYIDQAAEVWDRNLPNATGSWMDLVQGPGNNNGYLEVGEVQLMWPGCDSLSFACTFPLWAGKRTRFDDDPTWTTTGATNCAANIMNVKTIALHEFGHWVELNHPSGHPEAVMSFDCTDKQALLQDDRDGVQYQYGTELSEWVGSGGLNAGLGGWQPINHLSVYSTANTQYWTARGKGQASYRLGTLPNGGDNNRWKIDVDITLNSASGTGYTPQLYLIDLSGHWLKVGWMKDIAYPNTTWFIQSSIGNIYWGDASQSGNNHHFSLYYNPNSKFVAWLVNGTPLWGGYIALDNPYVLEQGLARAVGDSIDVTFRNFRITTDYDP